MTGASIAARFEVRFDAQPTVFWAPGRVNLLGDHVDYCGGAVLPMPIQFGTSVAVRPRSDGRLRACSANDRAEIDGLLADLVELPVGHWGQFLRGAIAVLADEGLDVAGADVMVAGDIPGSGLSSSASLTVALIQAFSVLAGKSLPSLRLALLAQRVEHEYVGVQCGLMDQAVIALAEPGCALWFDCQNYQYRSIPIDAAPCAVLVMDTRRARQLVHSEYNERLRETRAAASSLGIAATALARRPVADVESIDDPVVRKRARHVASEGARVGAAVAAIDARDWRALGQLLCASHTSLRDDYGVSCPELDVLAAALTEESGCYGARMTGAGFGGSVVALVRPDAADWIAERAAQTYRARFGVMPGSFIARSFGGVRQVDG
jgi:galactokinase